MSKKQLHHLFTLMWIMAVQTLVLAIMVTRPDQHIIFFTIWWVLAILFWWQFIAAMRDKQ